MIITQPVSVILVSAVYFIGFEETSSYKSVQFFSVFHLSPFG